MTNTHPWFFISNVKVEYELGPPITIEVNCGILGVVTPQVTGLDHLEGQVVSILADGVVLPQQTVQGGKVTLDDNYSKVIVGLPFESDLETLNIQLNNPKNATPGRRVKIGNVTFRVVDSRGGYIGPDENNLYEAFDRAITDKLGTDDLSLLFTGDLRMPLGAGYEDGGRVFYKQKEPLPVKVIAIIPEVKVGGAIG